MSGILLLGCCVSPGARANPLSLPSGFPDPEAYVDDSESLDESEAVKIDPGRQAYRHFASPEGLRCMEFSGKFGDHFVSCLGPIPGAGDGATSVRAGNAVPGAFASGEPSEDFHPQPRRPSLDPTFYWPLSPGHRIGSWDKEKRTGSFCLAGNDGFFACAFDGRPTALTEQQGKDRENPAISWSPHGFVLSPKGNRTF